MTAKFAKNFAKNAKKPRREIKTLPCIGYAACWKETSGNICGMRLLALLLLSTIALAQRAPGNPLDHLPKNIEVLTHFGERADISPDNQRVAFMTKSFGDAMVIDLKTRVIRCLTCNVPAAAFLRVMHLVTGDYILIGPDHFENVHISRTRDNELWFLSKERGAKPVKLGQKMSEGAAISKKTSEDCLFTNRCPITGSRAGSVPVDRSGRGSLRTS